MKIKILKLCCISLLVTSTISCSNNIQKNKAEVNQNKHNTDADKTLKSYTFDRQGKTTVDYSGQQNRMDMLTEISRYISNSIAKESVIQDSVLINMYSNKNNPFVLESLNNSGKQLRDKTAASYNYFKQMNGGGSVKEQEDVRAFIESMFVGLAKASTLSEAKEGVAGFISSGDSKILVLENGLEPLQVIENGLMAASFMDQISNGYLSPYILDYGKSKDDNTNAVVLNNKNYTAMEHYWDEAYGYVYGADSAGVKKYWSLYIDEVSKDPDFKNIDKEIFNSFYEGRVAIGEHNYQKRDDNANIIKYKLAYVSAVKAVYYLQKGKENIKNNKAYFSELSKAYGLIMSLRYTNNSETNNPYFSNKEVSEMLNKLISGKNGLWDTKHLDSVLDEVSNKIAIQFNFTVEAAKK